MRAKFYISKDGSIVKQLTIAGVGEKCKYALSNAHKAIGKVQFESVRPTEDMYVNRTETNVEQRDET